MLLLTPPSWLPFPKLHPRATQTFLFIPAISVPTTCTHIGLSSMKFGRLTDHRKANEWMTPICPFVCHDLITGIVRIWLNLSKFFNHLIAQMVVVFQD